MNETAEVVRCREYEVTLNITGAVSEQKPVDVMIVFDRSGSMEGTPLAEAKDAASAFLNQLTEDDRVGLVSYSDKETLHESGVLRACHWHQDPWQRSQEIALPVVLASTLFVAMKRVKIVKH